MALKAAATATGRYPALFITHGGGPFPLLNDPSQHAIMAEWRRVKDELLLSRPPKAIVVVSAHYETDRIVKVSTAAKPSMIYDYSGFPKETYEVQYPAPGEPELAQRIVGLLKEAGIAAEADAKRGFDHGVFVPLMLLVPEANIPVVSLSILRSQKVEEHVAIGRAIATLRDEGVLILGSGASSHRFGSNIMRAGTRFNDHLTKVLAGPGKAYKERIGELSGFLRFPGASEAQEAGAAEHLVPLFTVVGTSGVAEAKGDVEATAAVATEISNVEMGDWNERQYLVDA